MAPLLERSGQSAVMAERVRVREKRSTADISFIVGRGARAHAGAPFPLQSSVLLAPSSW